MEGMEFASLSLIVLVVVFAIGALKKILCISAFLPCWPLLFWARLPG